MRQTVNSRTQLKATIARPVDGRVVRREALLERAVNAPGGPRLRAPCGHTDPSKSSGCLYGISPAQSR
jgi:hypothetical protein